MNNDRVYKDRFSDIESIPIVNKFGKGLYSVGKTRCYVYFWSSYSSPKYYYGDLQTKVPYEEWFERLDEEAKMSVIFNLEIFK